MPLTLIEDGPVSIRTSELCLSIKQKPNRSHSPGYRLGMGWFSIGATAMLTWCEARHRSKSYSTVRSFFTGPLLKLPWRRRASPCCQVGQNIPLTSILRIIEPRKHPCKATLSNALEQRPSYPELLRALGAIGTWVCSKGFAPLRGITWQEAALQRCFGDSMTGKRLEMG